MGCCGSSARVLEAEEKRRRLTVGCVEADDTASADTQEDAPQVDGGDRSLLLELNSQQICDMIAAFAEKGIEFGARFSLSSQTDKNINLIKSFTSKETSLHGSAVDLRKEMLGYACKKGLKPESPNQDSFFILRAVDQFSIYGVFDGHGRKGHDVSNFVKDHLPKVLVSTEDIMEDPVSALQSSFQRTQKLIEHATNVQAIDARRSGTTASVVLHDIKQNIIHIAHVGDSRVVLAKTSNIGSDEEKLQAIDITEDHKPNLPAEKARIEQMGGIVIFDGGYNYRVYAKGKRYPGLNMSRAMGDLVGFYDAGISAMPDIATHHVGTSNICAEGANYPHQPKQQNGEAKAAALMGAVVTAGVATVVCEPVTGVQPASPGQLFPERVQERHTTTDSYGSGEHSCGASVSSHSIDPASDKFLLVCSDGVWEFISSLEAVEAVSQFRQDQAMEAAEYLATMSWDRWMHYMRGEVVDDITVVIIHLGNNAADALLPAA